MKTTVIIPSFNGALRISACINALISQTVLPDEIIVVLDGSTDSSMETIQNIHNSLIKVINQGNRGRAGARNAGVEKATGELLVFVDDDMRLGEASLEKHLMHHKNHQDTILVGNQVEDYAVVKTDIQQYKAQLSRKWGSSLGKFKTKLSKPFITAAHFSINKDLFLKLGQFDDNLRDQEDFDLAVRAFHSGISIFWDPSITGWHDDFITCKSYIKRQKEYKASKERIKQMKPEVYDNPFVIDNIFRPNLLKRFTLWVFAFNFWIGLIDNSKCLLILPKIFRFKIYEIVILSHLQRNEFVK